MVQCMIALILNEIKRIGGRNLNYSSEILKVNRLHSRLNNPHMRSTGNIKRQQDTKTEDNKGDQSEPYSLQNFFSPDQ